MRIKLETVKHGCKCKCCGERVRAFEQAFVVRRSSGVAVQGEKYCEDCQYAAQEYWQDEIAAPEQSAERVRESFAAYKAAGCVSEFWNDYNSGKI